MKGKKILSLLLCMLMMVSLFPVSAFADETNTDTEPKPISWELTEDGTLTISGEVAMDDYEDATKQPWADKLESIKSIVIEDGVTSIGSNAFAGCSILESVTIADTVTTIGANAFSGTALTSISIPHGITAIGEKAFDGCELLETVNVPCNWDAKTIPATETEAAKPLYTFGEKVKVEKTVHDLAYTVEGAKITAACSNTEEEPYILELTAPESLVYDGQPKEVSITNNIPNLETPEIKYNDGNRIDVTAEGFTASATITVKDEEFTASLSLNISPMAAAITEPSAGEITLGQPLSASTLSDSSWSWLDGTQIPAAGENSYAAFTKADNANYDYSAVTGYTAETKTITRGIMVKVNKAAGNGAVTIADWNYGDAANSPVPYSDTNGTDNVSYEYKVKTAEDSTYTSAVPAEVGEYTIKATFAATETYAETTATDDFSILSTVPELPPSAVLSPATPNGENNWYKSAQLTAPEGYSIASGADAIFESALTIGDGKYTDSNSYWLKSETGNAVELKYPSFNVDGTAPTISSATAASVTHSSASIQVSASDNLSELSYELNHVSGGNSTVEIGSFTDGSFSVSGMEPNTDYSFTLTVKDQAGNSASQTVSLTTTAQPVTKTDLSAAAIALKSGVSYTYTGSAIIPTADKLTVTLNGETIDITGFTIECSNNINAGEADIKLTAPDDSEYSGSVSGKFTIGKASATITNVTLKEKKYDGTTAVKIDTMTVGGFDSDDKVGIDTAGITAALPGSAVGTYTYVSISGLKLTGENKDNFTIPESLTLEGSFSILPGAGAISVELSADSFTYNGKEQKPTVTVKDGSTVIPASEYTLSFTDSVKAGTVTISVTDVEGGNYTVANTTKTYTIKPAKLTIAPKAVSVTRGATAPTLTYTVTGLISGEKIAANTSLQFTLYNSSGTEISVANAVKTAGTYTIKWTNMNSIVFGNIENYELSKVETANFVVSAPASSNTGTYYPSSTAKPSATAKPATTMQPTATTKPTATVPISGDKGSISVEANLVGSTAVISKLDTAKLSDVVGEAAIVSVDFSKLSTDIHTVQLPVTMVNEMAKDQSGTETFVIVLSDETSIAFDSAALSQKSAQAKGNDITVSVKNSDSVSSLTKAQREAINGKDAYDIKLSSGGKNISQLGGTITISAPYELRAGETAEGITVWYVDSEGNREACPTGYDSVSRRVTWQTDHLSLYMIDHEEKSIEMSPNIPASTPSPGTNVVDSESGSDLGAFLWIMLIALILMGIGGLVFFILRRRREY